MSMAYCHCSINTSVPFANKQRTRPNGAKAFNPSCRRMPFLIGSLPINEHLMTASSSAGLRWMPSAPDLMSLPLLLAPNQECSRHLL